MESHVDGLDGYEPEEVYLGKIEWENMLDRGTGHTEEITTAQSTIRALYDSGTPFFRKDDMRDLHRQLERARYGDHVHVRGLDGNIVEFEVETGRVLPSDRPSLERVLTAPYIEYIPFERLVVFHDVYNIFVPHLAYCNMRVHYRTRMRVKANQELILPPLRPYDAVKAYFDDIQHKWNKDEACIRFKSIIESALPYCNNVVSFALGELSRGIRDSWEQGPAFQHALLLSLCDALSSYYADHKVMCYAQDPAYTVTDKILLNGYGVTAVDDPQGSLQVDDSSAILSCAPNAPIKEIIADIALPALIIWSKVNYSVASLPSTDPESPRVQNMMRDHYYSIDFSGDNTYFGELAIYIRRR